VKKLSVGILILIVFIGLNGCATKYQYHSVISEKGSLNYKVNLKMEKKFKTLNPTPFNIITVYINNREVLKGPLSGSEEGSLEGVFENKKLELKCGRESLFDVNLKCTIHLGNMRLGVYKIVQTIK